MNTVLQESVVSIRVIKAFAQSPKQSAKFRRRRPDAPADLVSGVFSFLFPVIFLIMVGQAAVLYYGGRQIIAETLTVGEWQKFALLIFVFFPHRPAWLHHQPDEPGQRQRRPHLRILDAHNEVVDKPETPPIPSLQGRVEFRNVTFRYFHSGERC